MIKKCSICTILNDNIFSLSIDGGDVIEMCPECTDRFWKDVKNVTTKNVDKWVISERRKNLRRMKLKKLANGRSTN